MKKIVLVLFSVLLGYCAFGQYDKGVIIEPLLKTDTTSIGQIIHYPTFSNDEVTICKVTILPGKSTGWHKHSFPVFAYILEGNLTIEIKDKKAVRFQQFSSFAEVVDTYHNGVNYGDKKVVLIAFFMGEKNKPLSVHMVE